MSRVVLAMSGGVDSSVAAWLLREAGHEVIGLFMRHGQAPEAACSVPRPGKQGCCTAADAADARRIADRLGMAFYVLNFEQEFGRIIEYFVAEYLAGRTPNPCIVCNTWLKFGKLFEYADRIGADLVATGHYARLARTAGGEVALCRGRDLAKDQSYVLWGIDRSVLPRLCFPVGEHLKPEIRRIAAALELRVAEKPDSQEICFVPDQDHARFIQQHQRRQGYRGRNRHHRRHSRRPARGTGKFHHRPAQGLADCIRRAALCRPPGAGEPPRGRGHARRIGPRPAHRQRSELAGGRHERGRCQVKIRYRSEPVEACVECCREVVLPCNSMQPCLAVAPGQAAVCYDGDRLLGGGWID